MVTTASKFFYGLAFVLFAGGVLYGYSTHGGEMGPLSFGYKGAVGDALGYTVFMGLGLLALATGIVTTAFRDADPEAEAQVAGSEVPPAVAPAGPSWWPVIGAFALATTFIGLVVSNVLFVAGLIALGVVAVEWTMQAWADKATGDAATNRELRNRIMYPLEIPLAGALLIAAVVGGGSRILLAVSATGSVAVAGVLAVVILLGGTLFTAKADIRKDVVAGVLVLAAIGVLTAGVIAGIEGEREFHHHESDAHEGTETDTSIEEAHE